ncbi:RecQ family ATP-dependent DNA helicase [Larkinella punicea]|uniref:ATP-dependent DNA helicase RecQ n=1 Tax=Larkinella punicea TaxID=2315727 RepID=A0A368JGT8_9BACT|nr:ATP-dependent DNA helicase RecQ [Larkinella punicea]RCR66879.1 RecQ family ATP-dependent DNA helicase [Larkinella punicea]
MTIHQILKQFWGYESFRPLQEDIIRSVLDRRDTLVLLPTGGGKSVCFQVPALALGGVCLVVTPLIALMKDQVEQLRKRGISAVAIYSGMHWREIDRALDNCIYGNVRFLYVSPERLQTEILIERVKQMKISLLAVDEAHCISAWGYDFRPPYLQIAAFRDLLPGVPVVALTASATPDVQSDIVERLEMRQPQVFRQTFARKNLSYSAFYEENKEARLLKVLQGVPGSAIVYVRSRRQTQDVAEWLHHQGIRADYYHAGLTAKQRSDKQDAWVHNRIRVIVATNAFGMGIDKPDVRTVVHLDVPDSLEAYYQEAGRAGRDEKKAYAVLLYSHKDLSDIEQRVIQQYQPVEMLRRVYQALANYANLAIGGGEFSDIDFDLTAFCQAFQLPVTDTHYALKQLQLEGFIELSEAYFSPSKVMIAVDNRALYEFQVMNPHYDSFLKLLLRIYGGELFTNFVSISESSLAKTTRMPETEVLSYLEQLSQRSILVYEKQKDKPQLTFLTPRFDARNLPVNVMQLEQRKQRDLAKVRAMVDYVQNPIQCRTRLLQAYFGEMPGDACGVCDHCLSQNQHPPDSDELRQRILQYLDASGGHGLAPRLLADQLNLTTDRLSAVLRQMLADEQLRIDAAGNLHRMNTMNQR